MHALEPLPKGGPSEKSPANVVALGALEAVSCANREPKLDGPV